MLPLGAKVFEGNLDSSHVRKRYFERHFNARAIRLIPVSWSGSIAVRWEVLGCPGDIHDLPSIHNP